ncbi:rho guanine nucleotide exchange factor 2-like [Dendropsophus ebraccatus]|uniref:rho guanine nucleotide exchange factor 2-like n=1 Tax=Dendropsophus ebraccatus TaxID=150705 RepID=UPI0038310397
MEHNHVSTTPGIPANTESSSVNGSLDSNKEEDINQKDRNGNQLQNKIPQEVAVLSWYGSSDTRSRIGHIGVPATGFMQLI